MNIPFDKKELEIIGTNPPLRAGTEGAPVFHRPITPKKNLELLFKEKHHAGCRL